MTLADVTSLLIRHCVLWRLLQSHDVDRRELAEDFLKKAEEPCDKFMFGFNPDTNSADDLSSPVERSL